MKYHVPKQGQYESGLTAKLMYSIAGGLIKKHATSNDIQRLRETPEMGSGKLWMKPEIRSELDDFVDSYFFTDLREPLPGFRHVVMEGNAQVRRSKLEGYVAQLGQQYGSPEQGRAQTARLLNELEKRYDRACAETQKLKKLSGSNQLIKDNASDGFGHVFAKYGMIYLVIAELEKLIQS